MVPVINDAYTGKMSGVAGDEISSQNQIRRGVIHGPRSRGEFPGWLVEIDIDSAAAARVESPFDLVGVYGHESSSSVVVR